MADYNSTINRLHHRFFVEYILQIGCLRINIVEKSLYFTSIKLGKYDLSKEALKILMYSQKSLLAGSFFSV